MLFQDLKSPTLIVLKGLLFFGCVALSALGLCLETQEPRTIVLVLVLIWASARSYYFLFYVLHRYVDPSLAYSGLFSILSAWGTARRARAARAANDTPRA